MYLNYDEITFVNLKTIYNIKTKERVVPYVVFVR